jgi:hypothetical protein
MENIEVRTTNKKSNKHIFKKNNRSAIVFLRHTEDKIIVVSREQVEIEVIHNGESIFLGSKEEFFNQLKK